MRCVSALILAALLLGACSADVGSTVAPSGATTEPQATEEATPAETTPAEAEATPEATEPTPSGPVQYKPGQKITVTNNDEPWAEITVTKVKAVSSYKGEYYTDKPETKGNVYMQTYITYKALQDGVDYNSFDWQWFAGGQAVDTFTILMNGPEPTLGSGSLPKGRTAAGWLVQEVPGKGQVLLSYKGNMFSDEGPVFEVVLRAN